jgi:hypothetical protein
MIPAAVPIAPAIAVESFTSSFPSYADTGGDESNLLGGGDEEGEPGRRSSAAFSSHEQSFEN